MLRSIRIENGYGVHKSSWFSLESGLTAVTGPNSTGKSFIIEMIRYALFGMAALRGTAGDYKGLRVELAFEVKDQSYRIERTPTNAKLFRGDELITAGTKQVNEKTVEVFGYGLIVFDMAHAANQGEIEALGNMKPAERKRLVDSVIGLNVLDSLAEWAAAEALSAKREVETIERILVVPVEPKEPENYIQSAKLHEKRELLQKDKTEKDQIVGYLSRAPKPVQWPVCNVEDMVETIQAYQSKRASISADRQRANSDLLRYPPCPHDSPALARMRAQLDAFAKSAAAKALIAKYPKPDTTRKDLEQFQAQYDVWHEWKQAQDLLAKGFHTCPECDHQWPIEEVDPKWIDAKEPEKPAYSLEAIKKQRGIIERYEAVAEELAAAEAISDAADPGVEMSQIEAWERAIREMPLRLSAEAKIAECEELLALWPDRGTDLKTRQVYDRQLSEAEAQQKLVDQFETDKVLLETRLGELFDVDNQFQQLMQQISNAAVYETKLSQYEEAKVHYDKLKVDLETNKLEADQYQRVKAALIALKGKIKGHLMPSLEKVASMLLVEMTGGKRSTVTIDEDFNILVDGQAVNTLSGSEKAIANLAIRIGLGQVLTNRVFSVFMGDELDAAMDDNRAGYTAACLRRLTDTIKQVILVSHKRPDADNYIELGLAA